MVDELTEVSQWDLNFKAIKAKRKEMDNIKDSIKVDCINISTVVMKNVIEVIRSVVMHSNKRQAQ
eukprot:1763992-Amphidinium_carterae.1